MIHQKNFQSELQDNLQIGVNVFKINVNKSMKVKMAWVIFLSKIFTPTFILSTWKYIKKISPSFFLLLVQYHKN